jgi:ribokinase
VIVAGEIYIDLILAGFEFFPKPGQEAFAREFRREIGGGAIITACGLASLGSPAQIFGVVGADHYDWVLSRLKEYGVETGGLIQHPTEPTGFTVAITSPEDRTFFTYSGANRAFTTQPWRNQHVHLAFAPPWDTAAALLDDLHANACTVSLDAGWHESWLADARALELLSRLDIFFPNEVEAARITGETDPRRMLDRFHKAGLRTVALKLGARGSALLHQGEVWWEPAVSIRPIDTTGAGDCFNAGFLHAWSRSEPPQACLRLANLAGARSCEHYGGLPCQK